jgi:putative oxidoreductase
MEPEDQIMTSRNLARAVVFVGIGAIIASVAWWASYYNLVIRTIGENPPLTHPFRCWWFTSDVCVRAQATAHLPNFPPYQPLVLWLSVAILIVGLVLIYRSPSPGPAPVTPAGEPNLFIPPLEPFYAWSRDFAWPIVRVTVAFTLFTRGFAKVTGTTIAAFASGSMARRGLEPATPLAYVIFFNEAFGTVLVALGLFTRFAATSIAIEMFVLTFLAVFANGYSYTNPRGGWEVPLMWGLIYFAIALRGGGPYSLDRLLGREL